MNLKSIAALALAEDAAADPEFEEKHPRGNSGNKGQFRKSEKTIAKLDEADASISPDGQTASSQSPAAEYAAVEAKYKGTPEWMKSPNGKPTKLTEKQWVQVRTPSFKAWFGDWENKDSDFSVVMDTETEEPLVVYHGTPQAGFRAFDNPESPTYSGDGTFWFVDDRKAAERFAGSREDVDFSRQDQARAVYPVFLNIRRDDVEYGDFHGAHFDGSTGGKFLAMAYNDELYENYDGMSYFRSEEDLRNSLAAEGKDADEYEIRESEYDVGLDTRDFGNQVADDPNPNAAFILTNVVDTKLSDGHVALYGYDKPLTEYILKNPRNIKSATANSGAFSPDKESILDSAPAFNPAAFLNYLKG